MKKFLLSLVATFGMASMASAGVASFNFSEMGLENAQDVTTFTDSPISITFDKGTNSSNGPKYYTSGTAIRLYGGNTFTVASSNGEITQVQITFGSSDGTNAITTNVGEYADGNWTGSASSVVFTEDGTSGNRRIAVIAVTYGESTENPAPGDQETVEKVIFSESFTASLGDFTLNEELPAELTYVWTWGGTNYGAKASAYLNSTNYAATSWLVSPEIDLADFFDVYINFDNALNYLDGNNATDFVGVYVGTSGTTPSATTWTNLSDAVSFGTGNSWTFVNSGDVAVSGFDGQKVQFAFLYNSTSSVAPTWEVKNFIVKGTTEGTEDNNPETPEVKEFTVAEALAWIAEGNEGEAIVTGIVTSIEEISTNYGNATYFIGDTADASETLEIYRGYGLNGERFTSEDQLAVGATVKVSGRLVNYNGTYEFTTGSQILEYKAPEGSDQPGTDEPGDEGTVTFDFVNSSYGLAPEYDGTNNSPYLSPETNVATNEGITVTFNGDENSWRLWSDGIRAYKNKNASFTVSAGGATITNITWTVKSGATFALEGSDENITSWEGKAEEVTFVYTNTSSNLALITLTVTVEEPELGPSADIITVEEALELIEKGYRSEATVEGYIISITEISTQYGNATYVIADNADATEGLTIFRGKYIDGESFTSDDQIAIGGKVVVKGDLTLYNNTPEMNANNVILSYDAPTSGIKGIENSLEGVEFYNLNGVRVNNPSNGIYIIRQGDKTSKVVIK